MQRDGTPVLAVAHRAGNDRAALQRASALGVDVIEADVRISGGGLQVIHERPPRRAPDGVPRWWLQQLLDAAAAGTTLMLDLKGAGRIGSRVADAVDAAGPASPVLICGRWWPSVDSVARRPWARPLLSAGNRRELALLSRRVRGPRRPYGVCVHRTLLTPPVVRDLRAGVEQVFTWPVGDLAALSSVLEMGVTGVISDDERVLQAVVQTRRY